MKRSEFKIFLDSKQELDAACLNYLRSNGTAAEVCKIVDFYESFVVVQYNAGKGNKVLSISIWNILDDPPGCSTCGRGNKK